LLTDPPLDCIPPIHFYYRDMYPVMLALLSALLFGASTPVGKLLLEHLPPFQLAGWLYLGAAAGVAPGLVWNRPGMLSLRRIEKKNLARLMGAVGFGGIAGPVLLLMGLQRASAASVALWLNLELVATAVLGFLIFRDHLGGRGWCGVCGTLLASAMLSWQKGEVGVLALGLVAGACLCWGLDNHWTALIDGITPRQSTFWKGLVAGAVNLVIGSILEPGHAGVDTAALAMGVGAIAYGMSITLYIKAAQYLGATRSQMIFSSAPFFGVGLSMPLLGEWISMTEALAALLLIVSLVFLFRDQHSHRHTHDTQWHDHDHHHVDGHHNHLHPGTQPAPTHHHPHRHKPEVHAHPHWPDIHHRHGH
jgi:drug/metabolite transporter (DMT)-like permease